MANIQLNAAPAGLTGILVPGDGATLTATSSDGDWPATTTLRVANHAGIEQTYAATVAGTLATWTLTVAQVTALIGTLTTGSLTARITTGSGDLLRPVAAGRLSILSRWAGIRAAQSLGTIVVGPSGQSAYDVAVFNGFTGTEQEWLDTLSGFRAIADPDNPDLLIVTYPTWALDVDESSILIPILEA